MKKNVESQSAITKCHHLSYQHLLSHAPAAPLSPVGACATHASLNKCKRATRPSAQQFQHVECVQRLSHPHHHSTILKLHCKHTMC